MRSLWFLVAATAVIFAYRAGGRQQRALEALCDSPGAVCAVLMTPQYLRQHGAEIHPLPYIYYGLTVDPIEAGECVAGDRVVCSNGRWTESAGVR